MYAYKMSDMTQKSFVRLSLNKLVATGDPKDCHRSSLVNRFIFQWFLKNHHSKWRRLGSAQLLGYRNNSSQSFQKKTAVKTLHFHSLLPQTFLKHVFLSTTLYSFSNTSILRSLIVRHYTINFSVFSSNRLIVWKCFCKLREKDLSVKDNTLWEKHLFLDPKYTILIISSTVREHTEKTQTYWVNRGNCFVVRWAIYYNERKYIENWSNWWHSP